MSGAAAHRAKAEAEPASLPEAVRLCRRDERFLAELRGLYEEVDARSASRGARCMGGGGCCKFDLFGHRLYLTAGELALLTREPPIAADMSAKAKRAEDRRCPYQAGGACLAYARRPLGCRVFFCRPGDPEEQNRTYEEFHARIQALHERCGAPYLYVELTGALAEILARTPTHRDGSAL